MQNLMAILWTDLLKCLSAGKAFLLNRQNEQGMWQDYMLAPGASEAWTTSVVGWSLAQPPFIPGVVHALRHATDALHQCRKLKGWGYNSQTAVDADSTAWALRLLVILDDLRGLFPANFLTKFITSRGSARTFLEFNRFGTWAKEHDDVTPLLGLVFAEYGGSSDLVAQLRQACLDSRNQSGLWDAFWWTTESYAICRNLEFLEVSGGIPEEVWHISRDWLASKTTAQSTFEVAQDLMVAITLSLDITNYAYTLMKSQQEQGNWLPSPVLLIPEQRSPTGQTKDAYADPHSLMTTAMVTLALGRAFLKVFPSEVR